jgi:hypothetical protein
MFRDSNKGELDPFRLNLSLLTLIPMERDTRTIRKLRFIALTNCSFKIYSKYATNRLGGVNDELIAPNQTTFFRGSHILEFVVSAHKIIHDGVQRKKTRFTFKLDYEKAYDRVGRSFMLKKMVAERL